MAIAGFDVDGVIGDFLGYMRTRGISGSMTRDHGDVVDALIRKEMQRPGMWVDMKPTVGAKDALATLRGIKVVFISSIPREYEPLRKWWLAHHFSKYFTGGWDFRSVKHADKPGVALEYGVTHFIEDSPDTALAMKEVGIESFLVPGSKEAEGIEQITIGEYARRIKREQYGL